MLENSVKVDVGLQLEVASKPHLRLNGPPKADYPAN